MIQFLRILILFLFLQVFVCSNAQTNMLTYAGASAGNTGKEVFYDVMQLSNGNMLVIGGATDLDWISASVPKTKLTATGITNGLGTNKYAFILVFDSTLTVMEQAFYLPQDAAEDFRFIKTTSMVGQATGDIYLSGNTLASSGNDGYFIGKLNGNFVKADPTGFVWVNNVKAVSGSTIKIYHPWDVGGDGKVVYGWGDSYAYNFAALYRLDANTGAQEVVPNWRVHYTKPANTEYYGSAYNYPGGISGLNYSTIVFKRDGRCDLRSGSSADYTTSIPDGNGGTKHGKWPLDVLYDGYCVAGGSPNSTSGPGYTGYSPSAITTYGIESVCIDKRNNQMYIGFNAQTVLPGGQGDFEPAVMAMDSTGALKWWSRLYHEIRADGTYHNSEPDQYIDDLAIDYSLPSITGCLVVGARCHGNNTENYFKGNEIVANPGGHGFQDGFTGAGGNFHLSWLGKLTLQDGNMKYSTFMGEYSDGATLGTASTDPLMDGWPSPNSGFPVLNTTRLAVNNIKVTADGSVLVLAVGRRVITTSNAYQKMVKPADGHSSFSSFVRLYTPDLSKLLYSSLVDATWDPVTQVGGNQTNLYGVLKTDRGVIVVGQHKASATGNQLPIINIPSWGVPVFNDSTAVLAYYQSDTLINPKDNGFVPSSVLPVNLLSFTGQTVNNQNILYWKTAAENNSRGFYLQKSADGKNFYDLAFVASKALNGNSTKLLGYDEPDLQTKAGISYYRLEQVDRDGKESFSNVVALETINKNLPSLVCSPNPVIDKLAITISDPVGNRTMDIGVYDNAGKKVASFSKLTNKGRNELAIDTRSLFAGNYYVKVNCNNGDCLTMVQAVVKLGK